jgi:hypothetical protein
LHDLLLLLLPKTVKQKNYFPPCSEAQAPEGSLSVTQIKCFLIAASGSTAQFQSAYVAILKYLAPKFIWGFPYSPPQTFLLPCLHWY